MAKKSRPTGVTILAFLQIILGLLGILFGLGVAFSGSVLGSLVAGGVSGSVISAVAGVAGWLGVVVGLLYIAVGYGFLKGMGWSWWVALILYVLGIIGALLSILSVVAIVPLLIYIYLVYYLTRPKIKTWFGK